VLALSHSDFNFLVFLCQLSLGSNLPPICRFALSRSLTARCGGRRGVDRESSVGIGEIGVFGDGGVPDVLDAKHDYKDE
jgi:hypothetical protein